MSRRKLSTDLTAYKREEKLRELELYDLADSKLIDRLINTALAYQKLKKEVYADIQDKEQELRDYEDMVERKKLRLQYDTNPLTGDNIEI